MTEREIERQTETDRDGERKRERLRERGREITRKKRKSRINTHDAVRGKGKKINKPRGMLTNRTNSPLGAKGSCLS